MFGFGPRLMRDPDGCVPTLFPSLSETLWTIWFYSCFRVSLLFFLQKCWSEDGASPCVLIETPHKELEPADPSSFKQYSFKNLFIKASPIPRLRYRVFYTSVRLQFLHTSCWDVVFCCCGVNPPDSIQSSTPSLTMNSFWFSGDFVNRSSFRVLRRTPILY